MTSASASATAFTAALATALDAHARTATKQWWTRYLKGAAQFRGVKMADTRRVVRRLVEQFDLRDAPAAVMLPLAHACFAQSDTEDKLAGVLLLAEHALDRLDRGHIADLATPLDAGWLSDWNSCDWYCVKVLGPLVVAGDDMPGRCTDVAGWRTAPELWQRRAAAVAFVPHAATEPELFDGFTDLLFDVCSANTVDPTRWSQTSVGWLLRELSHRTPAQVRAFVDAHPQLSAEARRNALKYLAEPSGR